MTRGEFLDWLEILHEEEERQIKGEWYLARIAAEICRSRVENPALVNTKDFIITMEKAEEISPEERLARSKAFWGGLVGMKLD